MTNEQRTRYVFDAICIYKLAHDGCSPTRDELAAITRTNKTALHSILVVLEARGWLRRDVNHNRAGKIFVTGAVWLPPEGWQSPLDAERRIAERRQAAMQAGPLCECGKGVIRWQKRVTFPAEGVLLMCDLCRNFEVEMYGKAGIMEVET